MRRLHQFILVCFSMCLAASSAADTGDSRPRVRVVWVDVAPVIDGRLDEPVWAEGALIDEFVQVTPETGAVPSQRTEVRILTDGEILYLGIRCHDDDVSELVANRMMRDTFLFNQDAISFIFDTFNDGRHGYYFEVNPRGSRRDVLIEGGAFEINWDAIWQARSRIDADGWSVEVAIPFASLNFDPQSDTWGFNIARAIRGQREEARWADPVRHRYIANLGQAGFIEGLSGIRQGAGLEIVPSLALRRVDDRDEGRHETQVQPSGDLFYKLLPSVTASLTVNTDFGETEVDARQINLTRFSLYYPEKRAFFLQDELLFDFANLRGNGQPFFSRRIGLTPEGEPFSLIAGGKITGRVGDDYKIGLLNVQADNHDDVSDQNLTVARGAVNLSAESTLGAMVTHGSPEGGPRNTLAGIDFVYANSNFRNGLSLKGSAWFQKSFTQDDHGADNAYGGSFAYPNDKVNWSLDFMELGKDFNPALGFVNRQNIRQYGGHWRYRVRRSGRIRTLDSKIGGTLITDTDDVMQSMKVDVSPLRLASPRRDTIEPLYSHLFERLDEPFEIHPGTTIPVGSYHFDQVSLGVDVGHSREWRIRILLDGGSFYTGWRAGVKSRLTWRPSYHWLLEATYQYNDIALEEGDFQTHLARFQVNLQFTPDLAWITLVQWDNQSEDLGINSRLRWIIEDGREIFLIFNQDLDTQDRIRVKSTEPLLKIFWSVRF